MSPPILETAREGRVGIGSTCLSHEVAQETEGAPSKTKALFWYKAGATKINRKTNLTRGSHLGQQGDSRMNSED